MRATATGLLGAFRAAAAGLEAAVDEVNALNVFPVPDGDTGSNMMATVRAALAEAEALGPTASAERVAAAAAFGALMGARGNSGVITSQILRGLAEGLAGKTRFNALDLANALDQGDEGRVRRGRQARRGHDPDGPSARRPRRPSPRPSGSRASTR